MITQGLEEAVKHILEDLYYESQPNDNPANTILRDREQELFTLVKAEAVNLADKIIGKDRVLHSVYDTHGDEMLNESDKAVFDFQVAQRVLLADYQKVERGKATGPEDLINLELSENEG